LWVAYCQSRARVNRLRGTRRSGGGGSAVRKMSQSNLTTCAPGLVWDAKRHKCLIRHSGMLPDLGLIEYTYALAKAVRHQEAIDVLDLLDNPNTPRAQLPWLRHPQARTHRGRNRLLSQVGLA
jgi:hypothetical protein